MFSFFKKKDSNAAKVSDVVFISKDAKWNALMDIAQQQPSTIFAGWFDDSVDKFQSHLQQHNIQAQILSFRQLHSGIVSGNKVVFIEHYPLKEKEMQVFNSLFDKEIIVYSSLDEAFFKVFGGDNIINIMKTMGVADNEAISHSMITKSIKNAQEKLASKLTIEQSAHSQEEWMKKNVEFQ